MRLRWAALGLGALAGGPAPAGELYGGVHAQGVTLGWVEDVGQRGAAFQLGWRGGPLFRIPRVADVRPHVFGSVNTAGATNFAAAGVSAKLGGQVYVRPGVGLAVHDGPGRAFSDGVRTDLGSRVLFELELALGVQIAPRVRLEASYIHLSHGQVFSGQNPGLDLIGARVNLRLP